MGSKGREVGGRRGCQVDASEQGRLTKQGALPGGAQEGGGQNEGVLQVVVVPLVVLLLFLLFGSYVRGGGRCTSISTARPRVSVRLLSMGPCSEPKAAVSRIGKVIIRCATGPKDATRSGESCFGNLGSDRRASTDDGFIVKLRKRVVRYVPA